MHYSIYSILSGYNKMKRGMDRENRLSAGKSGQPVILVENTGLSVFSVFSEYQKEYLAKDAFNGSHG